MVRLRLGPPGSRRQPASGVQQFPGLKDEGSLTTDQSAAGDQQAAAPAVHTHRPHRLVSVPGQVTALQNAHWWSAAKPVSGPGRGGTSDWIRPVPLNGGQNGTPTVAG